jgi:GntR family histidine utilization transcriptional repressor
VESRILSGELKPGDKLPSELEMMETYGCSRMTVNKALSALSAAGLLQRRKRAGTIVAAKPNESMVLNVPDLPEEISRRGQIYRYQLIERKVRLPRKGNANEQALSGSGALLFVTGVHFADEIPLAFEERMVSLDAVPEIETADFTDQPPGSWLLRHIPWTEAENRITAVLAGRTWARRLGVPEGSACLSVERRTWRGDSGITMVRQIFVAERYELVARFGAA